jgi:hypothetical protein
MTQISSSVPNATLYADSKFSPPGDVSLHRLALTLVICLKTSDSDTIPPITLTADHFLFKNIL